MPSIREIKSVQEYTEWKKHHAVAARSCSGFSSRIYVGENLVVKEQILALHENEWHSLQLYRDDVAGMDETRDKILENNEDVEFTQKGMESIVFFKTHIWDSEEVQPMQRAARAGITPKLCEAFYVQLRNPNFRLGITAQHPLHLVFSSWSTEDCGICGRMARIGSKRIANVLERIAEAGLAHLDWNPANLGMTSTDQIQVIDWACSTKEPQVELRESIKDKQEASRRLQLLWRKTVMYKAFCKTWSVYQDEPDFFRRIYLPFCRYANDAEKTCRHLLEQIATPGTDYEKVICITMLESEEIQ